MISSNAAATFHEISRQNSSGDPDCLASADQLDVEKVSTASCKGPVGVVGAVGVEEPAGDPHRCRCLLPISITPRFG